MTPSDRVTRRAGLALIALLASVGVLAPLAAHEVAQEAVVQMFVQPQDDQLIVLLRLPTVLLADAGLPRLSSGHLDISSIGDPLRLVAADVADNLEVRQRSEERRVGKECRL